MPVDSLLSFLRARPSCKAVIKLREVATAYCQRKANAGQWDGQRAQLLCDAIPVLKWLFEALDDALMDDNVLPWSARLYGGNFKLYSDRLTEFVDGVRHLGIDPVFFFAAVPGTTDAATFRLSLSAIEEVYRDMAENAVFIQQVCDGGGDKGSITFTIAPLLIRQTIQFLFSIGVRVVQCSDNHCTAMVSLCSTSASVIGILSNNSDLAIINGSVFIDTADFDLEKEMALDESIINHKPHEVCCAIVSPQTISSVSSLSKDQLHTLAILCGNDYTFRLHQENRLCDKLQLKQLNVKNVAQWILKNKTTDILTLFPHNAQYRLAVEASKAFYSGTSNQTVEISNLCTYLIKMMNKGELTSGISLAVASTGVYVKEVIIQPMSDTPIELLFLPLRRVLYIILGVTRVREYIGSEMDVFDEIILDHRSKKNRSNPHLLKFLHKIPTKVQLMLLLQLTVSCQTVNNVSDVRKILSRAWQDPDENVSINAVLITGCLHLFKKLIHISSGHVDALLVAMLLCHIKLPLCRCDLCPTTSAITCSTQFAHLLHLVYELASLLGLGAILPQPKQLYFPLIAIPLLLVSVYGGQNVPPVLVEADYLLKRVLSVPEVQCFRNVFKISSVRSTELRKCLRLFKSAKDVLETTKGDIANGLQRFRASSQTPPTSIQTTPTTRHSLLGSLPICTIQPTQKQRYPQHHVPTSLTSHYLVSSSLPILEYRNQIQLMIRTHKVLFITGEAGCGKSTMVPQYILDDPLRTNSKKCRILVSQPHRVAVFKLADQVAKMRKDPQTVGYSVGGRSSTSFRTEIEYCTIGSLLQLLTFKPLLIKNYSHVILDEVHHRSKEVDFVVLMLKKIISQFAPLVKFVLMSATMHRSLFVNYFTETFSSHEVSTPLFVGFKCYPVHEYFIDQITGLLTQFNDHHFNSAQKHACDRLKYLSDEKTLFLYKEQEGYNYQDPVITTYSQNMCTELIIAQAELGNTILVFLPGFREIMEYFDLFQSELKSRNIDWLFHIFLLHSQVPWEDQVAAFEAPNPTTVNVILSTNVAESSVTIPDLKLVLDFGICRVPEYNSNTRLSHLRNKWCSKSSLQQRVGRVGRMCEGVAVHLFPRVVYDELCQEYDTPDILCGSLTKLVLQSKQISSFLGECDPIKFIQAVPQPPSLEQLHSAVNELGELGAIVKTAGMTSSHTEIKVTLLGRFCLKVPLDIELSRLVLFSIGFGCVVEGIIMAASFCLSGSLFNRPCSLYSKMYLNSLKRSLHSRFLFDGGSYSDLIQVYNLFKVWYNQRFLYAGGKTRKNRNKSARVFSQLYSVRQIALLSFESLVAELASSILPQLPRNSIEHTQVKLLSFLVKDWYTTKPMDKIVFCDNNDLIRALLVANFTRGLLYGVRECDSQRKFTRQIGEHCLWAAANAGFNLTSTIFIPWVKGGINSLREMTSLMLPQTSTKSWLVGTLGLIETTLKPKSTEDNNVSSFSQILPGAQEERPGIINSLISENEDACLLWQYGARQKNWQMTGCKEKFSRPGHPLTIEWTSFEFSDMSVRSYSYRNKTSFVCNFTPSPLPVIAVTSSVNPSLCPELLIAQDITVLPSLERSKLSLLLLLAFQSFSTTISQLIDVDNACVRGVLIGGVEILLSGRHTITLSDLEAIGLVRKAMSEIFKAEILSSQLPLEVFIQVKKSVLGLLDHCGEFEALAKDDTPGTPTVVIKKSCQELVSSAAEQVNEDSGVSVCVADTCEYPVTNEELAEHILLQDYYPQFICSLTELTTPSVMHDNPQFAAMRTPTECSSCSVVGDPIGDSVAMVYRKSFIDLTEPAIPHFVKEAEELQPQLLSINNAAEGTKECLLCKFSREHNGEEIDQASPSKPEEEEETIVPQAVQAESDSSLVSISSKLNLAAPVFIPYQSHSHGSLQTNIPLSVGMSHGLILPHSRYQYWSSQIQFSQQHPSQQSDFIEPPFYPIPPLRFPPLRFPSPNSPLICVCDLQQSDRILPNPHLSLQRQPGVYTPYSHSNRHHVKPLHSIPQSFLTQPRSCIIQPMLHFTTNNRDSFLQTSQMPLCRRKQFYSNRVNTPFIRQYHHTLPCIRSHFDITHTGETHNSSCNKSESAYWTPYQSSYQPVTHSDIPSADHVLYSNELELHSVQERALQFIQKEVMDVHNEVMIAEQNEVLDQITVSRPLSKTCEQVPVDQSLFVKAPMDHLTLPKSQLDQSSMSTSPVVRWEQLPYNHSLFVHCELQEEQLVHYKEAQEPVDHSQESNDLCISKQLPVGYSQVDQCEITPMDCLPMNRSPMNHYDQIEAEQLPILPSKLMTPNMPSHLLRRLELEVMHQIVSCNRMAFLSVLVNEPKLIFLSVICQVELDRCYFSSRPHFYLLVPLLSDDDNDLLVIATTEAMNYVYFNDSNLDTVSEDKLTVYSEDEFDSQLASTESDDTGIQR